MGSGLPGLKSGVYEEWGGLFCWVRFGAQQLSVCLVDVFTVSHWIEHTYLPYLTR
jgi:hypothetical protein